ENVVVPFGEKVATLVHDHIRVPAFDGVQHGRHIPRSTETHVPPVKVVRRSGKDSWKLRFVILWPIDVGLHSLPVAHRYHDLSLNHRDRLQLGLDGITTDL